MKCFDCIQPQEVYNETLVECSVCGKFICPLHAYQSISPLLEMFYCYDCAIEYKIVQELK